MRLLHVPYKAEQQMQFGLRQLCRYGRSDEKRPKMLAKEADICLSKGERGVLSFCSSAQVVFSLFQSGCRGRTEPHNSLHYERCISQCLVTPTAGRLFTPRSSDLKGGILYPGCEKRIHHNGGSSTDQLSQCECASESLSVDGFICFRKCK